MSKWKRQIKVVGKTEDGKMVISGVFTFVGSLGIPLDIVLASFQENNFVVDWLDFRESALKDGWKESTLISKLEEGELEFLKALRIRVL